MPAIITSTRTGAGDTPAAASGAPITQRVTLVAILLVALLVAYLDRADVSVLVADDTFPGTMAMGMGMEGQSGTWRRISPGAGSHEDPYSDADLGFAA